VVARGTAKGTGMILLAFMFGGFCGVLLTSVCVVAARADARAGNK
jgi:hypothetical protein